MGRLIGKKKKSSAARFFALLLAAVLFVGTGVTASAKGSDDMQTYDDLTPDSNYIVVQKTFEGIAANQIPAGFSISVGNNTLDSNNAVKNETGNVWTWRIDAVEQGAYTVKEQNYSIPNYDVTVDPINVIDADGVTIQVVAADIGLEINGDIIHAGDKNIWPIYEGVFFAASLTSSNCVVISKKPFSAAEREAINNYIKNDKRFSGAWKTPAIFYSLDNNNIDYGQSFTVNGKTITYTKDDEGKDAIMINESSSWNHVVSMFYNPTAAQNPEIAITNTYTPKTTNVTIGKLVKGNMGDVNKEFGFEITVGENNYNFSLKDGEDYTIENVPLGSDLIIKETNASGYKVTVGEIDVTNDIKGDNGYRITIPNDSNNGISITIVNTKNVNIDTGISLTSLPYILVLMTAAAGMLAIVLRRRRSNN